MVACPSQVLLKDSAQRQCTCFHKIRYVRYRYPTLLRFRFARPADDFVDQTIFEGLVG